MKILNSGYLSRITFQRALVNFELVFVQVCEQNSHDKLGIVFCEKRRAESVSMFLNVKCFDFRMKASIGNVNSAGLMQLPEKYKKNVGISSEGRQREVRAPDELTICVID